jgi:hydrogenase 3 maturation protease
MTIKLVFTVGNGMMGDDAAGPLLAQKMKCTPLENWEVLNGGNAPENYMAQVREMAPAQVLVVDAADMDLEPGEIRLIDEDQVSNPFIMTTHSLPLTFLMQSMRVFVPKVELLGVQPNIVAFGYPMSTQVVQAVEEIYIYLKQDRWEWDRL